MTFRIDLLSELTDSIIMIQQLKEIYEISDAELDTEVEFKIIRQLKRIGREYLDRV